jgi:predicted anti-sigma-YlaC factor YlaD
MMHLTMDQLLELDEPGLEPGTAQARAHLDACAACRAEYDRLRQRQARLRALPTLRPARDRWPVVARRLAVERRRRLVQRAAVAISAIAALLLLAVSLRPAAPASDVEGFAAEAQIADLMERSRALEAAIGAAQPDQRVVDGRTIGVATDLEARIADLDRMLEVQELDAPPGRGDMQRVQLWRERVGLLNALVDVHVTNARNVGL